MNVNESFIFKMALVGSPSVIKTKISKLPFKTEIISNKGVHDLIEKTLFQQIQIVAS